MTNTPQEGDPVLILTAPNDIVGIVINHSDPDRIYLDYDCIVHTSAHKEEWGEPCDYAELLLLPTNR